MTERIAASYRRFAEAEARGHSPLYEALALGVADDPAVLAFLAALPPAKQQPNLLLAAVRFICGTQPSYTAFRAALLDHAEAVRETMLTRGTQTNEPGRCAALLPVLARLPQPLALLEVGASAGLCLLPDRYGYDYGDGTRLGDGAPVLSCRLEGGLAPPARMPEVVWRAGLDLAPIDLADAEQVRWLEALVWPDQPERLARLRAAVAVARRDPPRVMRGDLSERVGVLAAEAPSGARLVVFHTAVLAYVVSPEARQAFIRSVRACGARWLSNEGRDVFPEIAARAGAPPRPGSFLLALDGEPVAWTGAHGGWARAVQARGMPN
jgi:hypothetical protein